MRYLMRKKLLSFTSKFSIKDDSDREVFVVNGAALTLRDRLAFEDAQGNELAVIEKKLFSWGPTYEIYHAGKLTATVKESLFTLVGHRFTVNDENGNPDLEAKGNFTGHQYTFTRGGQAVAEVSEHWFTLADTYGVDITPGQDDVLILACTVVIDRCQEHARHHG